MHKVILLAALCGCSNASSLGISANIDESQPGASLTTTLAPSAPPEPRKRSVISGRENELLSLARASVGDIDGDGMDDFIVSTGAQVLEPHVFLFYGRTDFPEQLTVDDADASFVANWSPTAALGDINCDGLADFSIGQGAGYEIVFGDRTRASGEQAAFSSNGFALLGTPPDEEDLLYLAALRPLGDLNADGCDDFAVGVSRRGLDFDWEMNPAGPTADFIVAGRSEDWPSGVWQDSWAVAQLGDEPPAYKNDGDTTIVQRMFVLGSTDLDGDGFSDLLAIGYWRILVYYGSEAGFAGTLTAADADATIAWNFKADDEIDFTATLPILIEDVDGDGTAEIGLPNKNELGILYGSRQRWSGRVRLEPELTIVRSMGQLLENSVITMWHSLEQNYYLSVPGPVPVNAVVRLTTTDLDGDGQRELVLQEDLNPWPASPENVVRRALYALTGPSRHTTGRYVLSDRDLYKLDDAADVLSTAALMDPGGDFDGDGSADLLFGLTTGQATAGAENTLHLLAGVPHDPD